MSLPSWTGPIVGRYPPVRKPLPLSNEVGRKTGQRWTSLSRQTPIGSRFASFVRISNLFVTVDASVKLLHPMYASRQKKRFATQTISASIDALSKLGASSGYQQEIEMNRVRFEGK
jgi:hypothetical protein